MFENIILNNKHEKQMSRFKENRSYLEQEYNMGEMFYLIKNILKI